ncbi:MAG: DUF4878 domain-containing protein [Bacteroidales bacterium]|nr:DUF4878 domain-containing protein [Bacteroidales bacterium]
MKRILSVLVAVFVMIAVSNCKKAEKPEKVAEDFLKYLAKGEYAKARELATGKAASLVTMIEGFAKEAGVKKQDQKKEVEIKDMKCEVKDKEATCTYKQDGKDGKIMLQQVEGKWKVSQVPKEMGGDMNAPMDDVEEENDTTKTQPTTEKK